VAGCSAADCGPLRGSWVVNERFRGLISPLGSCGGTLDRSQETLTSTCFHPRRRGYPREVMAVFPTGGAVNPSLTIEAVATRTARLALERSPA
jgi:hypothetical protein